jgi:hypothetical protein
VLRGGALQVGCILRANFGPLGLISFPISPTRSYDEAGRWRSEMLRWEHSSRRTTRKEHRRMVDVLAVRRRSRRGSPPCRVFWVIFAGEHRLTRPLTLGLEGDKEALAVFSYKEEAEMFLRSFGPAQEGWRVRETSAGEVVSLLYGPCYGAKAVALDPLPRMPADGFLGLVALERRRFVGWVTDREQNPMPPGAA